MLGVAHIRFRSRYIGSGNGASLCIMGFVKDLWWILPSSYVFVAALDMPIGDTRSSRG